MFKLKSILLSVLLLAGFTAFAQQITVTGVVTSSTDGYGVIGAAVMEKGTSNGCVTDLDGNFTLKVEAGKILEISCIGYRTIEVAAAPTLKVVIDEDVAELSEELSKKLGRKVRLVDGKRSGRIELEFYGAEDREKLIDQLRRL